MVPAAIFEIAHSGGLSSRSLPVGVRWHKWCPQSDSNRHCAAFETAVSCQLDYRGVIRR